MTYSKMLQILPMVIVIIALSVFMFKNFLTIHKKIFYKMLWNIFWTSFCIIIMFSFFYLMVLVIDIQTLKDSNLGKFNSEMLTSFQSINFEQYNKAIFIYIDLVLYSCSVFFHSSFQFQIIGPAQAFVILEGILGALSPMIILVLTLLKDNAASNEQTKTLEIFLNRSWSILRERKSTVKGYLGIELLSNDNKQLEILLLRKSDSLEELIKRFSVNWELATLDMVPYFARFLEEPINEKNDYSIALKSILFYNRKNKIDEKYYQEFYDFLLEIQPLHGMAEYQGPIIHMLNLLKDYLQNDTLLDITDIDQIQNMLEVNADE